MRKSHGHVLLLVINKVFLFLKLKQTSKQTLTCEKPIIEALEKEVRLVQS